MIWLYPIAWHNKKNYEGGDTFVGSGDEHEEGLFSNYLAAFWVMIKKQSGGCSKSMIYHIMNTNYD